MMTRYPPISHHLQVALIAPPFEGAARGTPLGLAQLAGMLEINGFDVHTHDMTVCGAESALLSFLQRVQPNVVGITAVCATYLQAVYVAELCRVVLGPKVKIIAGGPHVSFGYDVVLDRHNCWDACVLGEADHSFVDLCNAFAQSDPSVWKSVSGIAFRDGTRVRRSPSRLMVSILDALPLPARKHFPESVYGNAIEDFEIGKSQTEAGVFDVSAIHKADVMASRGCPYSCGFCSTKEFWLRKYRQRSPEHVFAELKQLHSSGHTHIYFQDDIFTENRAWVMRLSELLIDNNIGLKWACGTRVDRVDRQLLTLMKSAGCVYIYCGVESGAMSIRSIQSKGITSSQVSETYNLLHETDIYASAAIIFGLPGETLKTARETIKWIRNIVRPDEVWISKASCYPGTELARFYGVEAVDYELKLNGKCEKGLPFGTGGIYTPFFNDIELVREVWDCVNQELGHLSIGFGDDYGHPTAFLNHV